MTADFYRAFEDRHRGSRELIKTRLAVYLPFLGPLAALHPGCAALDVGCGRGEWLELLSENHIAAHGVDLDEGMLAACRERGLSVQNADALFYLGAQEAQSVLAVTGFHVAEHLPFEALKALFAQAYRVLKPGGLLILETPNPENLVVGTASFYIDPTHQRPLPWQLLCFMAEHQGFAKVKLLRLQEDPELTHTSAPGLYSVLGGASPDYAVVAQKECDGSQPDVFSPAFSNEYGLSLDTLANRFDQHMASSIGAALNAAQQAHRDVEAAHREVAAANHQAQSAHHEAQAANLQAQTAHREAEAARQAAQAAHRQAEEALHTARQALESARQSALHASELAAALHAVHTSHSWQITQPLRWLTRQVKSWLRR